MNKRNNSAVFYGSPKYFYQLALANRIEKLFQIHIDDIHISVLHIHLALVKCIVGASFRAKAKTVIGELRLKHRR
jgi:hypothetical protein